MAINHNDIETSNQEIIKLLAERSPHLPGHTWCGDWIQWMRNNHPLLGICFKYRESPIGIGQRITMLIGSIAFGIASTNFVYLYYHVYEEANSILVIFRWGDDSIFILTREIVVLWTLGGLIHSMVDLAVWHLVACACCLPGALFSCCGCLKPLGSYITISLCAIFVALATFAIIMRANYEEGDGENKTFNELTDLDIETINAFSFLGGYFIELGLVYFVYFPIVATLIFSGALRCCLIGGRPKAVEKERQKILAARKKMKKSLSDSNDRELSLTTVWSSDEEHEVILS